MVSARAWQHAAAVKCSIAVVPKGVRAFAHSWVESPCRAGSRFTQQQRLSTPKHFNHVFAQARRSSDQFFTILARSNDRDLDRLGLAISKRAARRAVDRNRLKRLVREVFRMRAVLSRCDFVVMAKPAASVSDNAALRRSLDHLFGRFVTVAAN
jgi:ribonuclease P protein component